MEKLRYLLKICGILLKNVMVLRLVMFFLTDCWKDLERFDGPKSLWLLPVSKKDAARVVQDKVLEENDLRKL